MPPTLENNALMDRHYVILIVRLTLDSQRQLLQGELADTTNTLHQRFIGAVGLHQAVDTWLQQQQQAKGNQEP